jgi:hypothetical protein
MGRLKVATTPIVSKDTIDMDGRLTKSEVLLHLSAPTGESAVFSNIPAEDTDPNDVDPRGFATVIMHHEAWEDMGEPNRITVTVEPGDHLNE